MLAKLDEWFCAGCILAMWFTGVIVVPFLAITLIAGPWEAVVSLLWIAGGVAIMLLPDLVRRLTRSRHLPDRRPSGS